MKPMNLNQMIIPLILTVLICAGFWLYTQWNLKKFEASLPKAPPVQTEIRETAPQAHVMFPQEFTEVTETPLRSPRCQTLLSTPQSPAR